jgi:triacylglycerol lipase
MQKPAPVYSLDLVFHPESDKEYKHFENAAGNPFQPAPTGFPRVNAWWLAEAALLAYWDPNDAIPIFKRAGFDCRFITADSTDCYLAWQKDFVIVAFRGTQPGEWKDILADINIPLVEWDTGLVHLGFKKAFDAISPQLTPLLQELMPNRTIWFCGHSLGAALATLAADRYKARGVGTLGSPRVGDATFVNAFNDGETGASLRFVNDNDVVTHVPPPIGYEHVDAPRFIGPDGTITSAQPGIAHFFQDLIGTTPAHLLEIISGLSNGQVKIAPTFLLDHMPKAYAIWIWNDYDAKR